MSIRRLLLTAAAMATIAVVLAALTPSFPAMTASLAAAQRTVDTQGPDVLISSAAGLLAWAVWAWGALGLALTAASALPGMAGGAARVALHVALPAGARRSAALLLGLGLGIAPLAGAALPLLTPAVADSRRWRPRLADAGRGQRRRPPSRTGRPGRAPHRPPGSASSSAATVSGTSPRTRSSRSSADRPTTARWPRPSTPGGSPTPTSSAPIPTSCCPARCCGSPTRRERAAAPTRPPSAARPRSPRMSAPVRPVTDPAPARSAAPARRRPDAAAAPRGRAHPGPARPARRRRAAAGAPSRAAPPARACSHPRRRLRSRLVHPDRAARPPGRRTAADHADPGGDGRPPPAPAGAADDLTRRLRRALCRPAARAGAREAPSPLLVGRVHVSEPVDGVAEISAVARRDGRAHAVAARLEGIDGRWQCTALQIG